MPSGLFGATSSPGQPNPLSMALAGVRRRGDGHTPGQIAVDLAVMIADGGAAISDVRTLPDQVLSHGLWPQRRRPGVC